MKFATERTEGPDGRLVLVSRDLTMAVPASGIASTLQDAIERWTEVSPALEALYMQLNAGESAQAVPFSPASMAAPLPRAWQWLDGSAFLSHAKLMETAFNLAPLETGTPLMYQGLSHEFLSGTEDVPLPSAADGIDFEGEIGVVTDFVPLGTTAMEALRYIRLVVLINDWSLRAIAPVEMKTGFGWIQAKPACSVAPVAVTLDELGDAWDRGRVIAKMDVQLNGQLFGAVPAAEMDFGFHELIAHAARTRNLCAGTIVGSGTVSSNTYREVGSCCIAERRAIEIIDGGTPVTSFMGFGDRVRMEVKFEHQERPMFGVIDQRIIEST